MLQSKVALSVSQRVGDILLHGIFLQCDTSLQIEYADLLSASVQMTRAVQQDSRIADCSSSTGLDEFSDCKDTVAHKGHGIGLTWQVALGKFVAFFDESAGICLHRGNTDAIVMAVAFGAGNH